MPCSRRRHDFSQIEDYNIFKLVFRWEVHIATKACQEQGISILHVVMETIRGLHTVAKEHIQGIVAALTHYQGTRGQVVFSDALMTNKMSTNPLNSFSFDFVRSCDGLHDLHGEQGDILLLARIGDSLHLPSESWLQYCNHLSEKHHAMAQRAGLQ